MNKLLLSVFMAGLSFMALSHTENEKLDTARYMVNIVDANTSFDTISDAPIHILEWSRPEVFFGININGWTVDEKKDAFDAYIRYIGCADVALPEWRLLAAQRRRGIFAERSAFLHSIMC